jgi:hypothetical protein
MPKYFFAVRQGDYTSYHSDEIELPDIGAVLRELTQSTGELLRDLSTPIEAGSELRVQVADEYRKPLFSLRVIAESHA